MVQSVLAAWQNEQLATDENDGEHNLTTNQTFRAVVFTDGAQIAQQPTRTHSSKIPET